MAQQLNLAPTYKSVTSPVQGSMKNNSVDSGIGDSLINFANQGLKLAGAVFEADARDEERDKKIAELEKTEDKERLEILAQRSFLQNNYTDFKTAHTKNVAVGPAGSETDRVLNTSNPDIANKIFKEKYDTLYTQRKVKDFKEQLALNAEKHAKMLSKEWRISQNTPDDKLNETQKLIKGTPFISFGTNQLARFQQLNRDSILKPLPHIAEVLNTKGYEISYKPYHEALAKEDLLITDGKKRVYLKDAVTSSFSHYLPKSYKNSKGVTISAATDVFNKAEEIQGSHVSQDGFKVRIFEPEEVHGEIYNEFNDRVTLAKSIDDPIFDTLNDIFASEDAYKLLELGKKIGDQYEKLKDRANTKYIALKKAHDTNIEESSKATKSKHSLNLQSMYVKSEVLNNSTGPLDQDDLDILLKQYADTSSWEKGTLTWSTQLGDNIELLTGKTKTVGITSVKLTKPEQTIVDTFKLELGKIEDEETLQQLRTKVLHGPLDNRPKNAQIKLIDEQQKGLEKIEASKKNKESRFTKESKKLAATLKTSHTKKASTKSSKDLIESQEDFEKALKNNPLLEEAEVAELIKSRLSEIETIKIQENNDEDDATSKKFGLEFQKIKKNKVTESGLNSLNNIVDKIHNLSLKLKLGAKIGDLAGGIREQKEATEEVKAKKVADKVYAKLDTEMNTILQMESAKAFAAAQKLQQRYESEPNPDNPDKPSPRVMAFMNAVENDPRSRDYREKFAELDKAIKDKQTTEFTEQTKKDQIELSNSNKVDLEQFQADAQVLVRKLKANYTDDNYQDAYNAVFLKTEMNSEAVGVDPVNKHIFNEVRRIAYLKIMDDSKTASSGRVPTSQELNPTLYTYFQNKIEAIDEVPTGNQKDGVIENLKKELQESYHTFKLPTKTYDDLYNELNQKSPTEPTVITARLGGLKIIRSKFLGSWGKWDDASEFLSTGGKESGNLRAQAELKFELWHTAWIGGDKSVETPAYGSLTEVEKLATASKYAETIVDYSEKGIMPPKWKTDFNILMNNWDTYQKNIQTGSFSDPVPIASFKGFSIYGPSDGGDNATAASLAKKYGNQ